MTTRTALTPEVAELADRAHALLAQHSIAEVIAIMVCERTSASLVPADDAGPELIDWRAAGLSKRVWHRLIHSGELPAVHVGRRHMARRADVLALAARRRVIPAERPARARNGMSADMQRVIDQGLGVTS